jgi:ribosomal protein S18 acetylase RimI-like enzyme
MTDQVVRAATPDDIAACVDLALIAVAGEGGAKDAAFWHGAFSRDLGDPQRNFAVAASGNQIVGYARAHLFEPEADAQSGRAPSGYYLIGLFVSPDHRRCGLGASLTSFRLDWIRQRADEAWFFANAKNVASIELHERFGFEEVTRRFSFPGVTFDGGEGILFRLTFHPKRSRP